MKFIIKFSLIIGLLATMQPATSQDTILLRNNERVVCTVTQIYPERIEYLNFGDSVKKQYYSYRKNDVLMVKYAAGKTDTFNKVPLAIDGKDTSPASREQYEVGFEDGLARYRPTGERWAGVGAGLGSFLLPAAGIVVPIVYSVSKIPARRIEDNKFNFSNNDAYRKGYLEGAQKRRRRAVWSSYGITTGTVLAGFVALLTLTF
jgi:hypothetical protein